jgi:hypothetical protein
MRREKAMPLLDHFHPPLHPIHHWEPFHSNWATRIADALGELLPSEFMAEEHTHGGGNLEIDVATMERGAPLTNGGPATTTAAALYTPPVAPLVMPAVIADNFEVRVFSLTSGLTLVAAIEAGQSGQQGPAGGAARLRDEGGQLPIFRHQRHRRGHRHQPPGQPAQLTQCD